MMHLQRLGRRAASSVLCPVPLKQAVAHASIVSATAARHIGTTRNHSTNSHIWERRVQSVPQGVSNASQVFIHKAQNAEIFDVEGRRYIDLSTGIAVCNTGHSHPRIVSAVKEQLDKFSHSCFSVNPYESYVELAEKLGDVVPIDGPTQAAFFSSGAEAVENAIKIARYATGRRGIISFSGGFHGRTFMAMSLTGKIVPYKKGFGPFTSDVYHANYPIAYHGVTVDMAMDSIETIFKSTIEPEGVAAVIVEPVLGEGGFYTGSYEFFQRLRTMCDDNGIVMIADEVQSGFGRTGRMFALDWCDVKPDIMTVAKAMAGGFPISGVVGRKDLMNAPHPGSLGGTYSGSPIGIAASLEVLKIIEDDNLCARAVEIGDYMKKRMRELQTTVPSIGDVRGPGSMIALEFVVNNDPLQPDAAMASAIQKKCVENGVMTLTCGVNSNVLRLLPPLTIEENILVEAIDILETTILSVQMSK